MTFHNELVMITGAANGIGKGLSLYYAEKGAQVIALDVDEEAGKSFRMKIQPSISLSATCVIHPLSRKSTKM